MNTSFHLRDDHQSKSEAEEDQVHAVHPAQEDKVRCHRWPKVTWERLRRFLSVCPLGVAVQLENPTTKLTFHLFNLPLPGDTGCSEILKIPLELDPFLEIIKKKKKDRDWKLHKENAHTNTKQDSVNAVPNLGHHHFVSVPLPAFSFAQSPLKLIHKLLSLPVKKWKHRWDK